MILYTVTAPLPAFKSLNPKAMFLPVFGFALCSHQKITQKKFLKKKSTKASYRCGGDAVLSTRVSNLQPICDLMYNYIVYTHSASELILEVFSTFDFFSLRKQTTSTPILIGCRLLGIPYRPCCLLSYLSIVLL